MGGIISKNAIERILHDPFYTGIIRVKHSGESFSGIHEPIVSTQLFAEVQAILSGHSKTKIKKYDFLFRQLFRCQDCGRMLVGELQKGKVYYRCHQQGCPSRTLPEGIIQQSVVGVLKHLEFSQEEKDYFRQKLQKTSNEWERQQEAQTQSLTLQLKQNQDRQNRLTDAYLDQVLDKQTFNERKTALLMERQKLTESFGRLQDRTHSSSERIKDVFELAGSAYILYQMSTNAEKRQLIRLISSNRTLNGQTLVFTPTEPFAQIANRFIFSNGCPTRDTGRVLDGLMERLNLI